MGAGNGPMIYRDALTSDGNTGLVKARAIFARLWDFPIKSRCSKVSGYFSFPFSYVRGGQRSRTLGLFVCFTFAGVDLNFDFFS